MKITFVLPAVNLSGGIRVVLIHAKALRDMGHDVRLVAPPARQLAFKESLKQFVRGKGWRRTAEWEPAQNFSMLEDCALDCNMLDRWRPVTDEDVPDADVIIATWWETAEWVNALSRRKGIKIYFVQGHETFNNGEKAGNTYWLPLHKIVVSRWLQDVMRVLYRDESCSLVENAVDHSLFNAPPRTRQKRFTVGFLASKAAVKNTDLAIDAVVEAKRHLPDLRVIAFGAHQPNQALPSWIEYSKSPPQETIPGIYSSCDAWLSTSRSEGFGLPLLEAMACRTPVLSTHAGIAPEIVSGDNGRLLPHSAQAFADAMIELSALSETEWERLSENACSKSREYSWDLSSKKFESALLNQVESQRPSKR